MDISKQVKPGENRIEVLVFNTLANHYLDHPDPLPRRPDFRPAGPGDAGGRNDERPLNRKREMK